jgi:hypothetical protein
MGSVNSLPVKSSLDKPRTLLTNLPPSSCSSSDSSSIVEASLDGKRLSAGSSQHTQNKPPRHSGLQHRTMPGSNQTWGRSVLCCAMPNAANAPPAAASTSASFSAPMSIQSCVRHVGATFLSSYSGTCTPHDVFFLRQSPQRAHTFHFKMDSTAKIRRKAYILRSGSYACLIGAFNKNKRQFASLLRHGTHKKGSKKVRNAKALLGKLILFFTANNVGRRRSYSTMRLDLTPRSARLVEKARWCNSDARDMRLAHHSCNTTGQCSGPKQPCEAEVMHTRTKSLNSRYGVRCSFEKSDSKQVEYWSIMDGKYSIPARCWFLLHVALFVLLICSVTVEAKCTYPTKLQAAQAHSVQPGLDRSRHASWSLIVQQAPRLVQQSAFVRDEVCAVWGKDCLETTTLIDRVFKVYHCLVMVRRSLRGGDGGKEVDGNGPILKGTDSSDA